MNTTIQNPVAAIASVNRPVMYKDIAEKLGMPLTTVYRYMNHKYPYNGKTVQLVRKTAEEMGYNKNEATCSCGKTFTRNYAQQFLCPACKQEHKKVLDKKRYGYSMNYWNGNFKTREEEIARMKELRAKGYSNSEVAKAIGRSYSTVLCAIGKQDPELAKQNIAMAAHIRAQKNAARKQYLLNKPIREYNAKVEAHNKLKAQVAQMEAELKPQTPIMEQASQIQINFPLVDLRTVQPTALQ